MTGSKPDASETPVSQQILSGYHAARENCALYRVSNTGILRIGGPDRSAFLQRQTTNDLELLAPGHMLTTILTSATGRVLDVLTILDLPSEDPPSGAYLAVTLPGKGSHTAEFLRKKIFFMDKVTVEDASEAYSLFTLAGPGAARALQESGLSAPPAGLEVQTATLNGGQVLVFGLPAHLGAGAGLLGESTRTGELAERLTRAGVRTIDRETAEILRIENGLPAVEGELNGDYTPLETNLEWAISATKGCYTGQEVIARQITYDKVTRQLAGIRLAAETAVGEQVRADGKAAGTITSWARSPHGGVLALAVLKRPHHEPGTRVQVGEPGQAGEVQALPFDLLPD